MSLVETHHYWPHRLRAAAGNRLNWVEQHSIGGLEASSDIEGIVFVADLDRLGISFVFAEDALIHWGIVLTVPAGHWGSPTTTPLRPPEMTVLLLEKSRGEIPGCRSV